MYEEYESKRDKLVSHIRMAHTDEELAAASIRLLQFDGESQKVWNGTTARDAFFQLSDILAEYLEKKTPREPWRS